MKRLLLAVLFISFSLSAETVMVETLEQGEFAKLTPAIQTRLTQVKTGVMEALFDGGHIFFDMYTDQSQTTEQDSMQALQIARRSGATWFLRIWTDERSIKYEIYDLYSFTIKDEGEILKSDIDQQDRMSNEEFFFEAGKTLGNSAIIVIRS